MVFLKTRIHANIGRQPELKVLLRHAKDEHYSSVGEGIGDATAVNQTTGGIVLEIGHQVLCFRWWLGRSCFVSDVGPLVFVRSCWKWNFRLIVPNNGWNIVWIGAEILVCDNSPWMGGWHTFDEKKDTMLNEWRRNKGSENDMSHNYLFSRKQKPGKLENLRCEHFSGNYLIPMLDRLLNCPTWWIPNVHPTSTRGQLGHNGQGGATYRGKLRVVETRSWSGSPLIK